MSYIGPVARRPPNRRPEHALAVLVALATVACGNAPARRDPLPWAASQRRVTAAAHAALPADARLAGEAVTSARMVERALQRRGLRLGIDGSVGALHGYVRWRHRFVQPREARVGDLVFFRRSGSETSCRDHVGIVEDVDASGRVTFREVRDGFLRRSHFHPTRPTDRRDESGRILNSFLRGKRADDPSDALYYAGQMVCAVGRIVPKP